MEENIFKESNILIVDDQQANIDVLVDFLDEQGYKNLISTKDPRDVNQLFLKHKPDIILLDLRMPNMSGFQVMAQLKLLVPKDYFLAIIVLTADITTESKKKALSEGAKDFITKPFDLTEVNLRIRNLLLTNYLMKQLQNQKSILEEKVKERTAELEEKNMSLLLAKEQAEASDKLKSAFLATMNHELRTPLGHIIGFSTLISEMAEDETIKDFADTMHISGNKLLKIIEDIFELTILDQSEVTIRAQSFIINDLFLALKNQLDITLEKSGKNDLIELFYHIDEADKSKQIVSDRVKITQLLSNMINNAVKFTDSGSIKLAVSLDKEYLKISIKDTGVGIPDDKHNIIFDSFRQVDDSHTRRFEGVGIGLAISKKIVTTLGGEISVISELNKGSEFIVTIPVIIADSNTQPIIDEIKTIPDFSNKTVLLVEDDLINLDFLTKIMNQTKCKVDLASNGKEALEKWSSQKFDVIIMDLKMPVMDGFVATESIRKTDKETPIIALTAYTMADNRNLAIEYGCNEFLTKPINKHILFHHIHKLFKEK